MLIGYLAAFIFILCLTAGIFLFGYAVRKTEAIFITFLEVLLGLFFVTLILLFQQQLSFRQLFTQPSFYNWLYLGLAAITGVLGGNYFSLLNLKWGGELLNSLLSPAITATVVLFSVATENASLSLMQACGIVLTLGAVFCFLWFQKREKLTSRHHLKAAWSGLATIACISATILLSVKGGTVGNLSIFHTLWLRMLLALPMVSVFAFAKGIQAFRLDTKFYLVLLLAVALQTLTGSYLWFAASYRLGIPLFQALIATLPFWVYGVEVYLLRKSKPTYNFLITALLAAGGVSLMML